MSETFIMHFFRFFAKVSTTKCILLIYRLFFSRRSQIAKNIKGNCYTFVLGFNCFLGNVLSTFLSMVLVWIPITISNEVRFISTRSRCKKRPEKKTCRDRGTDNWSWVLIYKKKCILFSYLIKHDNLGLCITL